MQTTVGKMLANVQNAAAKSITKKELKAQYHIQIVIFTNIKKQHAATKKTQTLDAKTTTSLLWVITWSAIIKEEVHNLFDVTYFVSA